MDKIVRKLNFYSIGNIYRIEKMIYYLKLINSLFKYGFTSETSAERSSLARAAVDVRAVSGIQP